MRLGIENIVIETDEVRLTEDEVEVLLTLA